MSRSWLTDATHEKKGERTMSCDDTSLHMERMVCWPVGTRVQDCPAGLAWAHEAWALPGGGLGHWDRFRRRAPALGSVGSGGRWLAGRRRPYGGQVGTLAAATACTCSRSKLMPGVAPPLSQTSFLTQLFFPHHPLHSLLTHQHCSQPIGRNANTARSLLSFFFFLFLGLSHVLNCVRFSYFSSDLNWPCCIFDVTK